MPARRRQAWTVPADVIATLRRRWERGEFLTMLASGQEWQPLSVPLHGPAPGELAADFGAAQTWVRQWEAAAPRGLRLEYKVIGGRAIGANKLPCRAWIEGYQQLWTLLGVAGEVQRFTGLLAETAARAPRAAAWMAANPRQAMASEGDWAKIIQTVCWIEASSRPGMYLRQVDVPGVDTKFIESRRGILAELLDLQLPAGRVDHSCPRSDFTGRYGFRRKPDHADLACGDFGHQPLGQPEILLERHLDVLRHGQRAEQRAVLEQYPPALLHGAALVVIGVVSAAIRARYVHHASEARWFAAN